MIMELHGSYLCVFFKSLLFSVLGLRKKQTVIRELRVFQGKKNKNKKTPKLAYFQKDVIRIPKGIYET